ncbi:MAG: hypothetical protein GXO83_00575 [Chlorobi bacterium]|nr:hypothetical protein [Chlorobiota bacterium]
MRKLTWIFVLTVLAAGISSCIKSIDYAAQEKKERDDFIAKNGITEPPKASGLYYIPQDSGTGLQPGTGDTVRINFIASRLNLVIFDTNIEEIARQNGIWMPDRVYEPLRFIVGDKSVIDGVDEGVKYMKEGGNAMLIIPSELAYQNYETVLFYVELVDVLPAYDTSAVR